MRLTLIRNATLILEYAGKRILIDPFFAPKHTLPSYTGKSKNPLVALPGTRAEIIEGIELILVSHLHSDHFDTEAQGVLAKSLPLFCQPSDEAIIQSKSFTRAQAITDSVNWEGITISRIDGHHGLGAIENIMGTISGFVLQADNEPTVYWVGDSVLCAEVTQTIQTFSPEIIITHSGGAIWADPDNDSQNVLIIMDAQQTLELMQLAPQATFIATHLEALDHCATTRAALRLASQQANLSGRLFIPKDGETLDSFA